LLLFLIRKEKRSRNFNFDCFVFDSGSEKHSDIGTNEVEKCQGTKPLAR
jgi:hypothetical protein